MKAAHIAMLGVCAALIAPVCVSRSEAWKTFESRTERFRVSYPASWNRLADWKGKPASEEFLDIINFPNCERLRGVVLIARGAEIQVGRAPSGVDSIESWIEDSMGHDEKLEQQEIAVRAPAKQACKRLVRLATREEENPAGDSISNISYFCSTDTSLYLVQLRHWEKNPDHLKLQATALKMALSLRSW
jgi:hypothetical protein